MESIWSKTAEIPARPRLEGDLKVEAAVIGGGMAGVLTAWQLRQKGVEAVVLEARRLGSGDFTAKAWGCDLTYDYVKINGDYRT